MRRTATAPALLALIGLACSDSSAPELTPGSFNMALVGDVSRSISGSRAEFGEGAAPGTNLTTWVLELTGGPAGIDGAAFVSPGGQPGNGEFDIVWFEDPGEIPDDSYGAVVVVNPDGASAGFVGVGRSGTLTITTSSASSMKGSFEFEAEGLVAFPGGGSELGVVLVTGEFDALPAPEPATRLTSRLARLHVGGPPR